MFGHVQCRELSRSAQIEIEHPIHNLVQVTLELKGAVVFQLSTLPSRHLSLSVLLLLSDQIFSFLLGGALSCTVAPSCDEYRDHYRGNCDQSRMLPMPASE